MTKAEQKAISTDYKDFPLLKAAYKPLKQWETELRQCRLSPEEVFFVVIRLVDDIRRSSTPDFDFGAMWNDVFSDLYDNNPQSENDTKKATAIILSLLVLYLLQCAPEYQSLAYSLTQQLCSHYPAQEVTAIQKALVGNFALYGDEQLKSSVISYMHSDNYISDDIQNLLTNSQTIDTNAPQTADNANRLSVKQILLLAQYAFDLSFDPSMSNQSAIAEFLSKLTGYTKESIRTKIPAITKMNQATQREAADLIRELESIGAKNLANLIKNNIQE